MPSTITYKTNLSTIKISIMSNFQRMPDGNEEKDKQLWEIAQRRASFKRHLISYVFVNAFLWIFWAINSAKHYGGGIPWPVWSTLGWGIGIVSHYLGAYVYSEANSVQREYEKLKQKQKQ
jgi:hypothetical protein